MQVRPDNPLIVQGDGKVLAETNHDRYIAYIERYDPQRLGEEASGFTSLPSVEASTLLPKFLEIIKGPRHV